MRDDDSVHTCCTTTCCAPNATDLVLSWKGIPYGCEDSQISALEAGSRDLAGQIEFVVALPDVAHDQAKVTVVPHHRSDIANHLGNECEVLFE